MRIADQDEYRLKLTAAGFENADIKLTRIYPSSKAESFCPLDSASCLCKDPVDFGGNMLGDSRNSFFVRL